jgi:hypothetical protein
MKKILVWSLFGILILGLSFVVPVMANGTIDQNDSDNDGVPDFEDKCPNTIDEQLVYGCSCAQILELKPGEDTLENRQGCSKGVVSVFENAIGWAKDLF